MKTKLSLIISLMVVILFITSCAEKALVGKAAGDEVIFTLTSSSFDDGEDIPPTYTCDNVDGDGFEILVSPPLTVENVPATTESLVLIMEDIDTTPDTIHWILFNWDPTDINVEENTLPNLAVQGITEAADIPFPGYAGPCPPIDPEEVHQYNFVLYALNTVLDASVVDTDADTQYTAAEVRSAMADSVVEEIQFRGFYYPRTAACGDGIVDTGETCDDANTNMGDGCSDVCAVETDYTCGMERGYGSICTAVEDTAPPTVTVTCTGSATVGETVECTCTASDSGSGVSSVGFADGTASESILTDVTGTFTSSVCTAIDNAGNSASATGSYTVSAASSGGGAGGEGRINNPPQVDSASLSVVSDNLVLNVETSDADGDLVKEIVNWIVGNSITVLNMPFEAFSEDLDGDGSVETQLTHVKDYSGQSNDGTVNGAELVDDAERGNVYQFDGDDYIDVLGSSNVDSIGPEGSIAVWVYPTDLGFETPETRGEAGGDFSSSVQHIFTGSPAGTIYRHPELFFDIISGENQLKLRVVGYNDAGDNANQWFATKNGELEFSNDQWYFIVATWSDSSNMVNFYVNGVESTGRDLTEENLDITPAVLSSDHRIGYLTPNWPRPFYGKMDDLQLYNRVLTPEQILAMYDEGAGNNNIIVAEELGDDLWRAGVTPNDGITDGETVHFYADLSKDVWASIIPEETTTFEVANAAISITKINFGVSETAYGNWVQITREDSLPVTIEVFSREVYQNLEVTNSPSLEGDVVRDINIEFRVEKSWLTENVLEGSSIALFRYHDDQWDELPTTQESEDDAYVYYTATSPGFSYFIVGERDIEDICDPVCAEGETCEAGVCVSTSVCGDGTCAADETEESCAEDCLVILEAACGDGAINEGEECDDGNTDAGDGCSAECLNECGDGTIDEDPEVDGPEAYVEECDDGGTEAEDGCSADCQTIEPGYSCEGEPSVCCVEESEIVIARECRDREQVNLLENNLQEIIENNVDYPTILEKLAAIAEIYRNFWS